MKLIPLVVTKETVDVKKGGIVTYETGADVAEAGIILLDNPGGDYGVVIVNQLHPGGSVKVVVRPVGQTPVKKYNIGDTVAQLAVF